MNFRIYSDQFLKLRERVLSGLQVFASECQEFQPPIEPQRIPDLLRSASPAQLKSAIAIALSAQGSRDSDSEIIAVLSRLLPTMETDVKKWVVARFWQHREINASHWCEALIGCLETTDEELRELVVGTLGSQAEDAIGPLVNKLRRPSWWNTIWKRSDEHQPSAQRLWLARSLRTAVNQHEDYYKTMMSGLPDDEPMGRSLRQSEQSRHKEKVKPLSYLGYAYERESPLVRAELAFCGAISHRNPTRSCRALIQLASHEDAEVRFSAIQRLSDFVCVRDASDAVTKTLFEAFCSDNSELSEVANDGLNECGELAAKYLRVGLEHKDSATRIRCARFVASRCTHDSLVIPIAKLLPTLPLDVAHDALTFLKLVETEADWGRLVEDFSMRMIGSQSAEELGLGLWGFEALVESKRLIMPASMVCDLALKHINSVSKVTSFAVRLYFYAESDRAKVLEVIQRCLAIQDDETAGTSLYYLKELSEHINIAPALPSILTFIRKMKQCDSYNCRLACELIEMTGVLAQAVLPQLYELITGNENPINGAIAHAIYKLGGDHLPLLQNAINDLKNSELGKREAACDTICEVGPLAKSALPELIAALASQDWDLQWAAADALGAIATLEAVPALVTALDHRSGIVVNAAMRALHSVGSAAVPILLEQLEKTSLESTKEKIADVLGEIHADG